MFARTPRLLLRPGWMEDASALAEAIGDPAPGKYYSIEAQRAGAQVHRIDAIEMTPSGQSVCRPQY